MNVMTVNLLPFVIAGGVLVLAVIAMIVWRTAVSTREDDTIHVLEDAAMVSSQVAVARKLAVIDRWGKLLTVVTIIYAAGVAALYVYQVWMRSTTTGM